MLRRRVDEFLLCRRFALSLFCHALSFLAVKDCAAAVEIGGMSVLIAQYEFDADKLFNASAAFFVMPSN